MISYYRLGDLVFIGLNETEKKEILDRYPNSIGAKYIIECDKRHIYDRIGVITHIILEKMVEYSKLLPKDINNATLIHLRLGDVVGGNEWHEKVKRPLEVDLLKSLVKNNTDKKYVIGKPFLQPPVLPIMMNA